MPGRKPASHRPQCLFRERLRVQALQRTLTPEELARVLAMPVERAQAVYDDIRAKRRTTAYLHLPPQLLRPVPLQDRD